MEETNTKQQIVEKLKNSTNILVTVGANPSVDELSAALALTLMLDRMDKHGTAVFSGAIPPAINFLEPQKTFENSVDSLRDFIIALDKEKADRLRYKVEDNVVRIFITPYKTVLSEKDLQFSQGDFNVELIVALGVEKRDDLDTAITAHGRILHDATVVTMNRNGAQSSLGALDWTDTEASSLCEMLMGLSEALQPGLVDQQIATAILTGIVAATDRFRNERTTPKVMTMSAQLMAAGANQQLIADKLEEGDGLTKTPVSEDSVQSVPEGDASTKLKQPDTSAPTAADGTLQIEHTPEPDGSLAPVDPGEEALQAAEAELADNLEKTAVSPPEPTLGDMSQALTQAQQEESAMPEASSGGPQIVKEHRSWQTDDTTATPSFGGTLSATASDAEEEKHREEASSLNHQILSHDVPGAAQPDEPVTLGTTEDNAVPPLPALPPSDDNTVTDEQPAAAPLEQSHEDAMLNYEPAPVGGVTGPTLSDLDASTRGKATEDARAAVDAVLDSIPFDPAHQPLESSGAVPALEVAHTDTAAAPPMQAPPMPPASDPIGLPTPPPLPPLPDFSTLPPSPTPVTPPVPLQGPDAPAQQQPVAADPGQFRIPGQ